MEEKGSRQRGPCTPVEGTSHEKPRARSALDGLARRKHRLCTSSKIRATPSSFKEKGRKANPAEKISVRENILSSVSVATQKERGPRNRQKREKIRLTTSLRRDRN